MKRNFIQHEPYFLTILLVLLVGGLFLLSSASVHLSQRLYGSISYMVFRQALAALVGAAGFFLLQFVPYKYWRMAALPFMVIALILLVLVFVPGIGRELKGANRWIQTGFGTFQPSEIAKLALVIFLAWWLDRKKSLVGSFRYGFLPFLVIMGLVGGLVVFEPDLGTFGVMAGTALLMFFVGGGRIMQVGALVALVLLAAVALSLFSTDYRMARVNVFLNPELDPQGAGYQVRQAAIAIGSGGFWGVGYGNSQQKYNYLPEPVGDSVFAIVAEEFGFLGTAAVIFLFLLLLWRGMLIARRAPDMFAKLLVTGIVSSIVLQAFINMGAISGLLPLTGIPLPFISYGGTSLAITLASLGIVYQIAKQS